MDRRGFIRGVITSAAAGAVTLATEGEVAAFAQPGVGVDVLPARSALPMGAAALMGHAYVLLYDRLHYAGRIVEIHHAPSPNAFDLGADDDGNQHYVTGLPRHMGSMRVELMPAPPNYPHHFEYDHRTSRIMGVQYR
jgi:hypothetical protein